MTGANKFTLYVLAALVGIGLGMLGGAWLQWRHDDEFFCADRNYNSPCTTNDIISRVPAAVPPPPVGNKL